MKINIAKYDENALGGGWSWVRNFSKIMSENISDYDSSDIYLIPSASMVSREEVIKAKDDGKKIILRCDNIIRNSRNRNTGMTRMRDFSQLADLVVFQSMFALDLLRPYLYPDNSKLKSVAVIHNSVDQSIFNAHNRQDNTTDKRYLYSKYSSDETKNWEMARLAFQEIKDSTKTLTLAGRFGGNLEEYNFDFYMGERVNHVGLINSPEAMATVYKNCDVFLYSYFNDACSNTLIEALSCGLDIKDCYGMLNTGGAPEIMKHAHDISYFGLPRMAGEYYEAIACLL